MAIAVIAVVVILVCSGFLAFVSWKVINTPFVPYTPWLVEMMKRWSRSDPGGRPVPPKATGTDQEPE